MSLCRTRKTPTRYTSRVLYPRRMSKLDAQRAMRAARYDAARAASSARPTTKAAQTGGDTAPRASRARAKAETPSPAATDASIPALCGHRSMGGKACRRPAGHSETTHRYA